MSVIIRNNKLQGESHRAHTQATRPIVRREVRLQPGRHLEPGSRDARLQEIEDRLLAKMIATHENRDRALDRLLHDVLDPSTTATAPRLLPLKGDACISRRLRQTEDLLVAAVIENHPNAETAINRLIDDLFPEDLAPAPCEWDNDWDGMA